MSKKRIFDFARFGKIGVDDQEEDDYSYWDNLGSEMRFQAAWELVIDAYKIKGLDQDELRFQRTIGNFGRKES